MFENQLHYNSQTYICEQLTFSVTAPITFPVDLVDIKALSSLHHMIELDCSHNQLTECLALEPAPANLRYADCSFNAIAAIPDLSAYGCLEHLNLDSMFVTLLVITQAR